MKILSGFTFLTLYVSMRAPPLLPLDLDVIDILILYTLLPMICLEWDLSLTIR